MKLLVGALGLFLLVGCGPRQTVTTTPPDEVGAADRPATTAPPPQITEIEPTPETPDPVGGTRTPEPAIGDAIIFDHPPAGSVVRSNPFTIRGRARTFENNVVIRLLDSRGHLMRETFTTATGEMGTFSPFEAEIWIPRDPGPTLTVALIEHSAKDGSVTTRVPRQFQVEVPQRTATLYFSTANGGDCSRVQGVERSYPATQSVIRLLVEALIDGPTEAERARGVSSPFPRGSQVREVNLRNGTAIVDFNYALQNVGGSCRVQAIWAMVERTLTALPEVQRIEIRAEGSSELALQP
jgi:hypothetical protein